MRIRFWGVRGSFPVSSAEHERYGGNTPCIQVDAGDSTVIIDAGTGIRAAGKQLLEHGHKDIQLLLSHTHWDHIQGFPHFDPLYQPDGRVTVHSFRHPERSLGEIFREQQRSPYFPVSLDEVEADVEFVEHEDGDTFHLGSVEIVCRRLNHPGITGGFRLESEDRSFAYLCDVDLYGQQLMPHDMTADGEQQKQQSLDDLRQAARDLAHRAHALVCDSFFLPDEYEPDWGHSSPDDALRLAHEAEARTLILFHHRPGREDDQLDQLLENYRRRAGEKLELVASREGLEITL